VTESQQELIDEAHKSLEAARLLIKGDMYGYAASRAYYSMFYVAEAFLLERGLHFSSHSAVVGKFGEYFAATGELPATHHRRLIAAQEKRLVGDYHTGSNVASEDAAEMIEQAEEFIALAENKLNDNEEA
jgi:uncharacterized protein (UPF0332 family)